MTDPVSKPRLVPTSPQSSDPLVLAIQEQTQRMIDIAVYQENTRTANYELEGRASLARFIFSSSIPLMAVTATAAYGTHTGMHVALIIAKVTCFVGVLFATMCMVSGGDRWRYQLVALSNAAKFEARGVGDGIATSMLAIYTAPSFLPGRVESAGVAAVIFWTVIYVVLLWVY